MNSIVKVNRRAFIKACPAAGAGLIIGFYVPAGRASSSAVPDPESFSPNAFLSITTDGKVTIWSPRSEMGQGVRSALPMIVAEELDADWETVEVQQADLAAKYGNQLTGGSLSIRTAFAPLRKAGAAAREMLVAAAAQKWAVDAAACRVEKGRVVHSDGRAFKFAELASAAARLPVPANPKLKDPKQFTLLGKATRRKDTPPKVDGSAKYGLDVRVPGMLFGAVIHCPVFNGSVKSFDATRAKQVKGVKDVIEIKRTEVLHLFTSQPGGPGHSNYTRSGLVVLADSTWAAFEGQKALKVEWEEGPNATFATAGMRTAFETIASSPCTVLRNDGDVEKTLADSANRIEAIYEVPFLAHAAMEPVNCTAHATADGCEIWGPTQIPGAAAASVARALGVPKENVKVHITYLGGGFGRRLNQDYAVEAALASKAAGAPVQLVWTREEDVRQDFYRPASYHHLRAALDSSGQPAAWWHRAVSPSISVFYEGTGISDREASEVTPADFPAGTISNFRVEYARMPAPVGIGYWRSVENSTNGFVLESFLDEVAAASRTDPVTLRLKLLEGKEKLGAINVARYRKVIETAAAKGDWGKPMGRRSGRGFAAHVGYGSYTAQVAEVSVAADGQVKVTRVVCVIDCGQTINPDTVKAQMEGSIAFGLTAALKGEITIERGRVQQSNFHNYQMLRIGEMPRVEVHIIESGEAIGGTGEPGVPPVAPAVCNAIFAATGKRIRSLPVRARELATSGKK